MAMICATIPRDKVAQADQLLAEVGSNFRIQSVIDQIDFDPEHNLAQVDEILSAADELDAGRPQDCVELLASMGVTWVGEARDRACDNVECQRTFWEHVLDFLLWLAEQVVQLLDYIVDALRVVVAWLTWVATALAALALAIAVVVGLFTGGIGTVVMAVAESPILAVLGIIAGLGLVASLLLSGLNALFEWLQQIIRDARAKFCGDGIPSLPDWDPNGPWFPPAFPQ